MAHLVTVSNVPKIIMCTIFKTVSKNEIDMNCGDPDKRVDAMILDGSFANISIFSTLQGSYYMLLFQSLKFFVTNASDLSTSVFTVSPNNKLVTYLISRL